MIYPARPLWFRNVLFGVFLGLISFVPFVYFGGCKPKTHQATEVQIAEKADPIEAIASLSEPETLKTLKPEDRSINGRMDKILYWLFVTEQNGITPEKTISQAFNANDTTEPRREMASKQLLENYKRAKLWGLFTSENLTRLKRGDGAFITKGSYLGQLAEIDHILPVSRFPQFANELANLQIMPAIQNRANGNRIGRAEQGKIKEFQDLPAPLVAASDEE